MKRVRSKFIYGLTATPTRQDGHHPILFMHLGPIRYQVDAKEQAAKRPFNHVMIPSFTGAQFRLGERDVSPVIGQYYAQMVIDDIRNHMIVDDVLSCVKEGRNCLVLSERTAHVRLLASIIGKQVQNVMVLTGGKSNVETKAQFESIRNAPIDEPLVLCATGRYIGEGFDEPRLDTLFLAMPISWQGTLAQYVGRLHRLYAGKREVRVYDYIDNSVEMLERMYHKRLKGYGAIGYQVSVDRDMMQLPSDIIYDQHTFVDRFLADIEQAQKNVLIVSPYVTIRRVRWLKERLSQLCRKGVAVRVVTRPASSFRGKTADSAKKSIEALISLGVVVHCQKRIHQKYAIIDEKTVWYGSINLLSFGSSQESIMRLVSGSVARAIVGSACS